MTDKEREEREAEVSSGQNPRSKGLSFKLL